MRLHVGKIDYALAYGVSLSWGPWEQNEAGVYWRPSILLLSVSLRTLRLWRFLLVRGALGAGARAGL